MNTNQMQNIWEQVKENQAKLNKCQLHEFTKDVTPNQSWNKQYECIHCGGYVPVQAKRWYEMGVTHEKARAAYERVIESGSERVTRD